MKLYLNRLKNQTSFWIFFCPDNLLFSRQRVFGPPEPMQAGDSQVMPLHAGDVFQPI
jgi:hypothetical protein